MLWIPEFKSLWERDKSKTKAKATKEFAYIYFVADYQSEYNIYGFEKNRAVAEEVFGNVEYKPDESILAAIVKYESFQETLSMQYLKSVRATVHSLMKFYEELRFRSETQNAMDYDPSKVTKAMKDVEDTIEKIEKWEKKVRSEEEDMSIRGGGQLSLFEDANSATWLNKKK